MEVSGRRHKKGAKASEYGHSINCEPCDDAGETILASGYCKQCGTYVCPQCIKFHRRTKVTKHHEIFEGANMPQVRPLDETSVEPCPIHTETHEVVKFFCSVHDEIGCGDCMVTTHRTCKVDYIADIAKTFMEGGEFKEMLKSMNVFAQKFEQINKSTQEASIYNDGMSQEALKKIRHFRKEFDTYLDDQEKAIIARVESTRKENQKILHDASKNVEMAKSKLNAMMKEIDAIQHNAEKMFIIAKRKKLDLIRFEKDLKKAQQDLQAGQNRFSFKPDETLAGILQSNTPLGALTNVDNPTDKLTPARPNEGLLMTGTNAAPRQHKASRPSFDLSRVTFRRAEDVNIRCKEDDTMCWITGSLLIKDDMLILADYNNKSMKILNPATKKVMSRLALSTCPWEITQLSQAEVAVTLPNDQKIQILSTRNGKLEKIRDFKVNGTCKGICYHSGKLCVSYQYSSKIEIMDTRGNVSRSIETDESGPNMISNPFHVIMTPDGKKILVSDFKNNTVTMMTLQGHVLATYKDETLVWPTGMCLTNDNILVCGGRSHNIHLVSQEGKQLAIVLTGQDGVEYPQSVCLSEDTKSVYVSKTSDLLKVYTYA